MNNKFLEKIDKYVVFKDYNFAKKEYRNYVINNLEINSLFEKTILFSLYLNEFETLTNSAKQKLNEINLLKIDSLIIRVYRDYIETILNKSYNDIDINKYLGCCSDVELSFIYYIKSKQIEEKKSILYLKKSFELCSKNLASAIELYKRKEELKLEELSNIFRLEPGIFNLRNSKRKKHNFKFTALGGGNEIGKSSYLLSFNNNQILVDCGLKNTNNKNEYPNFDNFEEAIKKLEVVIITHAHMDHIGAIIKLYKVNSNIKFIMTKETKELTLFNLKNSDLSNEDLLLLDKIESIMLCIDFKQSIPLQNGVKITLYRAGHILGAASVLFEYEDYTVFVTGDYCVNNQLTVRGIELPNKKIDYLITESTYGNLGMDEIHSVEYSKYLFCKYVKEALENKKKVLIPAFAIGRSQEIISIISDLFKKENTLYVDGASREVCNIYKKFNAFETENNVQFVDNYNGFNRSDFIDFEFIDGSNCVVTSSGMLVEGSSSYEYLKHLISDNDACCILTGYQSEGTLGRKLQRYIDKDNMSYSEEDYIELDGEVKKINCKVVSFGMSAHCHINEIFAVISKIKPLEVILIHGDNGTDSILYDSIYKYSKNVYLALNNKTLDFAKECSVIEE